MGITFDEKTQIFDLQSGQSSWQMKISKHGHLLHLYYGKKIANTDLSYLSRGNNRGFSGTPYAAGEDRGYSLDTLLQEYSTYGIGDYRTGCLHVEHANGSRAAELIYDTHKIYDGKYNLPGLPAIWAGQEEAQTLEIVLKDKFSDVEVVLYYGVLSEFDTITRACKIRNGGSYKIFLHKVLSCCLDIQRDDLDIISFYGGHVMERTMQRQRVRHGKIEIGSIRGSSSHQENPFAILCEEDAGEEYGECYGAAFVYSGNFQAVAEVDQINQTRFCMGIHPEGFCYVLEPGEEFVAPEVVFSFSGSGYGKLSRNYHGLYKKHLIHDPYINRRRPVLINNWEATTFDFHEDDLVSLATSAKELGIEMFVMDDGWFGKRNGEKSGLGDWFDNREKLPTGVKGIAKRIHEMGMLFGIWVEPEMINEDSMLFRNHPDWCLRIPGREPNLERYQLVLDMTRKDVRDYLFEMIGKVLDESKADYVKWDMNRSLSDVWSAVIPAERQGEVSHRYVLGVYELMERFRNRYPHILWEGCSGGGGRFDAGMLYYMPQIWCSDNTDALDRIHIQYGTSFGYPISCMGAHVSVSPNLQTGRVMPVETRAVVAMAGSFGYELDVRKLKEEERERVKEQIIFYKQNYHLIHDGEYYRLTNPEKNHDYAAWQFVKEDGSEALLSFVQLRSRANPPYITVRVKGLKENGLYRIDGKECIYEGSALMNAGISMPVQYGDYLGKNFKIQEV